ncbi:MAG TPA: hypothetical protein VGR89_16350, partial [Puia sp.]|nr:hypothetical protein [Puia sp.]
MRLRKKMLPRLWDCFIFGDELDILECRLYEYAGTNVYRHVIVEANVDHQGHPKPFHFLENRERFAPYLDRIIYIPMTDLTDITGTNDNWARIHEQRNRLSEGLKD